MLAEYLELGTGPAADEPFLVVSGTTLSCRDAALWTTSVAERLPTAGGIVVHGRVAAACLVEVLAAWSRGAMVELVDGRDPAAPRTSGLAAEECPPGLGGALPLRLPVDQARVILRTSGSSGEPKRVAHRLTSLLANAIASNARTPFGRGDRWLLSLSPHHIGGLSILVRALVGGGAVRVGRGPGAVVQDLLEDSSITHLSIVAAQLRALLDAPFLAERLPRMRAILLGGGPTPREWRDEALRRGWPLRVTYGLTECASQVATGDARPHAPAGDAGPALDGVTLRVAEDGEILVAGRILLEGYLEGDAIRDPRRGDGFFATGDRGRLDAEGRLEVLGRVDAMFVSGGENIQPAEIENVLCAVPGITAACIVPVDDPRWQRRPVAFVAGTFDAAALEAALAARLPRFKWPDRVYAMPAEEVARSKPRRASLESALPAATILWSRPT